jgi:hypothetical protein
MVGIPPKRFSGAKGQQILQLGLAVSLLIGFVAIPTSFDYWTNVIQERRTIVPALESSLVLQKMVHEHRQEFRRKLIEEKGSSSP